MDIGNKNILWLDLFDFLSYNKKRSLLSLFEKDKDIRQEFLKNKVIREILSKEEFDKMALSLSDAFLDIKLKEYEQKSVKCITFYDNEYPFLLKEISAPPLCLYCKGNTQLLQTDCVAVVGTRTPSDYGIVTTKQFTKELAKAGLTIVSGLATGVDTIAHTVALEEQGNTIAVLAGGLDHIYPASNYNLARKMLENNLILSEFPPTTRPLSYYFPLRNRIIAGLSKGVLITEAGEKSGALHTVEYAVNYGREVFAIPGKINAPLSKGTNKTIKTCQSSLVMSPSDIFDMLHIEIDKKQKNLLCQLDINLQIVLDYIKTDKHTFQEILEKTGLSARDLNLILMELEMAGLITKLANNSYIMS